MSRGKALTTIDLAGPHRQIGDEIVFEFCPVCGSDGGHFAVNAITGYWNCLAGRHTTGGGRIRDRRNLYRYALSATRTVTSQDTQVSKEVVIPYTVPITSLTVASKYLKKRNISEDTITKLALADWRDEYRIFIPFFNEVGDVVYYTGRDYLGTSSTKYRNASSPKTVFFPDQGTCGTAYKAAKYLVICEGPLDAVAIFQCVEDTGRRGRWRVAAIGGARPSADSAIVDQLRRAARGRRVLVWLDADGAGQAGGVAMARMLEPHAEKVLLIPRSWHGTCKDPGEVSTSGIMDILQDTERWLT